MFSLGVLLTGMDRAFANSAKDLRNETLYKAMEDSLQIILQSTMMGFMKRSSPDGTPWKTNPTWYQLMKGQDSPLTGPVSKEVLGGPFAGLYQFEKVNTKRMKNCLVKTNKTTSGLVDYGYGAEERAALTQGGGESEMTLVQKSGVGTGQKLVFDVKVAERPHLGAATYPRIGGKNDAEWIQQYFGDAVEIQISSDFK